MALTHLPPGELAAVVTYLEMRTRPATAYPPAPSLLASPLLAPSPFALDRRALPDPDWYRALFRRVGTPWLWFSRLAMDDRTLTGIIHHEAVEVYAVVMVNETRLNEDVGLLELDFREAGACGLAYVALAAEWTSRGHGSRLLAAALESAWRPGIARVHLQTCTLDHPAALPAYLRAGFAVCGRAIETFPDPRETGLLPRTAAPQVPLADACVPVPASRR